MDDSTEIYDADSTLDAILEAAARSGEPVRVKGMTVTYRLRVELDTAAAETIDILADYDPTKVDEALNRYAGSWSDLDAEMLKRRLYLAREEGSRTLTRP